ncbi:histidine kinase [Clostridium carboxidivorans P7]|uniref:histidine kinase n=1 Tax=Clostridium carboxidivorans P7 TaxID=536227 RepID=C6PNX6_9CLOT|nr:ATP-binding protein [Clostridium carboxidivorans]AKN31267.1 histidine kinase [Clostridium carboxidivorans P7]EET89054.1 histidine kinase [Clostridium carboxidivorans P7]EFG88393.1 ATPase, histidine kinase-, DNA gyrase B-, and HSP90-like domain protein [Clostridium carboxidivorans P7]
MKKSLRKKMSLSYILVTIICVLLISLLSNFFLKELFKDYIVQDHETKNKAIVSAVSKYYLGDGKWNNDEIKNLGVDAIENGLFISIKDVSGKTVWDAEAYNNSKCNAVKNRLIVNMETHFPKWKGVYTKDEYPIVNNSNKVGTVEIGYYGPFYYNDNDILYINALNKILICVGIVSLCIALVLGLLMAKRLSNPIMNVIDTAEMISKGNYSEKIQIESDIEEIDKLATTINNLGTSLCEQEKLRQRLTRDISHELRTPLSTLQSHMEALIDRVWEPTTERLTSCHEEILRLKRLVGDLEKLAEYEGENLILNKTKFNMREVINNIAVNFEKQFLDKGVQLILNAEDISIYADKDKIIQVIVNLISNALKYTEKDGKVEVNLLEDSHFVKLSVRDTGIGISEVDLQYIFERFYRADESRNKLTGGAGIGLTITKSIIEAHNGSIVVESKINEGSEFVIMIPQS